MADEDRSALARFGNGTHWKLDNGYRLDLGETIVGEGPGQGFAMYPWVLDHYERVLRLKPGEAWLLKRMIKHAWGDDAEVYLSLRKVSLESEVSRSTLIRYMQRLVELGYVELLSDGNGLDRRKRYSVKPLYAALTICIAADRASKWAEAHGGAVPLEEAKTLVYVGRNGRRFRFNLNWDALQELAARKNGAESDDEPDWDDELD